MEQAYLVAFRAVLRAPRSLGFRHRVLDRDVGASLDERVLSRRLSLGPAASPLPRALCAARASSFLTGLTRIGFGGRRSRRIPPAFGYRHGPAFCLGDRQETVGGRFPLARSHQTGADLVPGVDAGAVDDVPVVLGAEQAGRSGSGGGNRGGSAASRRQARNQGRGKEAGGAGGGEGRHISGPINGSRVRQP